MGLGLKLETLPEYGLFQSKCFHLGWITLARFIHVLSLQSFQDLQQRIRTGRRCHHNRSPQICTVPLGGRAVVGAHKKNADSKSWFCPHRSKGTFSSFPWSPG